MNGELVYFRKSKTTLSLIGAAGKVADCAVEGVGAEALFSSHAIQHDFKNKRFLFINVPDIFSESKKEDRSCITIFEWNYATGRTKKSELSLSDLFELKKDGFHPKRFIPVSPIPSQK